MDPTTQTGATSSRQFEGRWDATIRPWLDSQDRVMVAGDWHGSTAWAQRVVRTAAEMGIRTILQVGDLAVLWPGPETFTRKLENALALADMRLVFVDGNHDSHTRLRAIPLSPDGFARVDQHIWWAPRGHRWEWAGRKFGALGGAFSVDWRHRNEGVNFWAGVEEVDPADVIALGNEPLDVLLSHEAPLGVPLRGSFRIPPDDEYRARLGRELVAQAIRNTGPTVAFHGHWHQRRIHDLKRDDGGVTRVFSLGMQDDLGNWAVLDLATMTVSNPHQIHGRTSG